jgi:hypothetical protein
VYVQLSDNPKIVRRVGVEPTHTTVSEWLTETNRLLPPDKYYSYKETKFLPYLSISN